MDHLITLEDWQYFNQLNFVQLCELYNAVLDGQRCDGTRGSKGWPEVFNNPEGDRAEQLLRVITSNIAGSAAAKVWACRAKYAPGTKFEVRVAVIYTSVGADSSSTEILV